ncbi:zinc-finger domain-domain-containing protein [Protomyces lactucae-debilis]|uniref:Zinc-finger domain-domain-containing protein n=1 Tax=Protomyces lactucae-debilis TaxID=2754530 RepID=A0A1Y2FGU5_PROLT|nr:zinc-finger domain-containing protein [Protomyces lactucae-debilis]ORY83168.1 zinc-finger domain-domain-containing protein [Protomyces lactucae-debilis]
MLRSQAIRLRVAALRRAYATTPGSVKANLDPNTPTIKHQEEAALAKAREVAATSKGQSPNRQVTWSNQQQPRDLAFRGPRFEQTDFDLQPAPQAAIQLIAQQPIRMSDKRIIACDGGGGALGHPKVYINLDKHGEPHACNYCGLRFQMKAHAADEHLSAAGGN